jgi:uncharacterized protein YdaU (DUF1376 family)
MGKDPAFLFYPNDWLGGTLGMTFEEKGAYLELLMLQFNRGHMTGHMIGQIVGQLWDKISCKFEMDEQGLFYNKRLEEEVERRSNYVESRKNNMSGKNQYSNKSGHMTTHTTSHMDGHTTGRMENENENENIDDNGDEIKLKSNPKKTVPYQAVADLWNDTAKSLKSITRLSEGRKRLIKSRYAEGGLELIEEAFEKVNKSDYLNGRTGNSWQATFDWVLKAENWVKVLDGNYDNKGTSLPLEQMGVPVEKPKYQKVSYKSTD